MCISSKEIEYQNNNIEWVEEEEITYEFVMSDYCLELLKKGGDNNFIEELNNDYDNDYECDKDEYLTISIKEFVNNLDYDDIWYYVNEHGVEKSLLEYNKTYNKNIEIDDEFNFIELNDIGLHFILCMIIKNQITIEEE
jgi:hypothetical protein